MISTSLYVLGFSPIDFIAAAGVVDSIALLVLGIIIFSLIPLIIWDLGETQWISLVGTPILLLMLWGAFHEFRVVNQRLDIKHQVVVVQENDRLAKSEEAFDYAYQELEAMVDRLGGKSLGCSNYKRNGDFLLCSLATENKAILEVECPWVEGIHGCLLTENAYSVIRNQGFDVNIDNKNSNSNSNVQKPT